MVLGLVIGHATATIKHASLMGWRMLLVQVLDSNRKPEGDLLVAVDRFGAGAGQVVVLTSDGKSARQYVGNEKSPVRWCVIALAEDAA
ncbi:MAG TPA: EutN/CcmL family microcompartment protein [Tepidisphaeraceae bacterium]|jgi:ethanolamine utilization protein EutN|nr:EutN/CcmL family microcompartment protein [Tepidisphaeraceae bacterium]